MKTGTKRAVAAFLVWVQMLVLLTAAGPQIRAADDAAQPVQTESAAVMDAGTPEIPALNKTIVGTVAFQSFNFLGDNDTGEDGTDYHTTFYYTDDYFAPSAINEAATSETMLWSDLEDPSLAACSFDFAIASYTSAEGDVIRASSQTWNNTDYSGKDKNVKQFLGDCGFTNIEPHGLTEKPTNDSVGYTLGSKTITVWNADTQKNETYTLIAVGVRGAGYGAEWASNITIGDPSTNALPANGRHYGFDHSAQIVCQGIRDYLSNHNITGNVKYWVTGFSRAAAVANLVAGYLTDGGSTYKTQQKDVFGYTWECPQAASTNENALNYKNIHNIINPMDTVPKVSPDAFEHQRLGVDYQMPYHGNATASLNDTLYRQMFEVLKTIAVGNGTDPDPLVDDKDTSTANDGYVSPSKYPYNSKMTIYKMSGWQLIQDAIGGTDKLMSNFGTVVASGNLDNSSKLLGRADGGWYIDQFIDNLIDVFLTSNAWVGETGNNRTALQNRTTFIQKYQNEFRNLLGYFLDFSGPAFLGMIPKLVDAIRPQLTDITNLGLGYAFYKFYNEPNGSFSSLNVFAGQFRGKPYKTALIYYAKNTAKEVANDMTSGFTDPQGISKATMNNAMDAVVELVINLYAYELDAYESQYLGTTLRYLNTILCTHEQETVLSWIMSLDPNHMNRGYRTITLPKSVDVKLYECRSEYGETLGFRTSAPLVAEFKNGEQLSSLDDRIFMEPSGSNMVIRYPASLDLRFDVTTDSAIPDLTYTLADYGTKAAYTNVSAGKEQYQTTALNANYQTLSTANSGAKAYNDLSTGTTISLKPGETLSITAAASGTYDNSGTDDHDFYAVSKTAPKTQLVDFGTVTVSQAATLDEGSTSYNGTFAQTGDDVTYSLSTGSLTGGWQSKAYAGVDTAFAEGTLATVSSAKLVRGDDIAVIPSSSVYFDDALSTHPAVSDGHGYSANLQASPAESDLAAGQRTITFTGTGIDVYCTTYDTLDGNSAGYVQAKLDGQTVTVRSQSDVTRYNVPTISFTGLPYGEHTLTLNILNSSHYRFDGVRIYGAVEDQDLYTGTDEQYATYINLRDALVNDKEGYAFKDDTGTVTITGEDAKAGALYVDDPDQLALTQTNSAGNTVTVYQSDFEAYKANSPKNEIYLESGKAITFSLNPSAQSGKLWIGLSAPEAQTVTTATDANVEINDVPTPVTSAVDMYYPVTLAPGQTSVTIENTGSAMIAVTNLKITGSPTVYAAAAEASQSGAEVSALNETVFEPVTLQTVKLASNNGFDPDAPKVNWDETADAVPTLLKALFQLLLQSLDSLFSGVQTW